MYFPGIPVVKSPPSNARGEGSIPGVETKILYATWHGKNKHTHTHTFFFGLQAVRCDWNIECLWERNDK